MGFSQSQAPRTAPPPQAADQASAIPGTSTIVGMMGVEPKGPKRNTRVARPDLLPWRPVPNHSQEWSFEDGHWVFHWPADKTETLIGREGDTRIFDPRDPSPVSRQHAIIRKISNDAGEGFVLIQQRGDVAIVRGDQYIYLQGRPTESPTMRVERTWLEPEDKIMLALDVSFIFRPSH
jgi:hypothetical protein